MNRALLRSASLCIALMSSLFVVSCSSSDSKVPHTAQAAHEKLCAACVNISVHVWKFTPDAGIDVAKLSDAISKHDQSAEIEKRLRHSGHAELVLNYNSVTTAGQSLPLSTRGTAGEFSAVLTPATLKTDTPELINYEIRAAMPHGGMTVGQDVYDKGYFLIKDGGSLLSLQKVREGYVVWLITTKNPV